MICQECKSPCCQAVKRLPYQGERDQLLFSTMLMGAMGDLEHQAGPGRRPMVAEWMVPGEAPSCPGYDQDGRCSIYDSRPFACRSFPRNSDGSMHPFCPHPEAAGWSPVDTGDFKEKLDALDTWIMEAFAQGRREDAAAILGEDSLITPPLLFNGYLIAVWLLAGCDVNGCIEGQKEALASYRDRGLEELTFLIPETDYQISGTMDGLEATLLWLAHRVEEEELADRIRKALVDIKIL